PIEPPHALRGRACDPIPSHRAREINSSFIVVLVQASLENGSNVVDLQVHPFEPLDKLIAPLRHGSLIPRYVVLGTAKLDHILLASFSQLEGGILAHGLVQSITSAVVCILLHDQGSVDQR